MGINSVGSYYMGKYAMQKWNRSAGRNASISDDESIGNATSFSESSDNGKRIGLTTVGNVGYIAMYADLGIVSSKEYWLGFFEGATIKDNSPQISEEEYREFLKKQIEELQEKIENGDTEESFQIGSQNFTIKEWKEFLDKFDSVQEVIEELMRERHRLQEKEKLESERAREEYEKKKILSEILFSESISCACPSVDSKEEVRYITWYTEEGIFCRKDRRV